MANVAIGYYVHHHGTGHMTRALQISAYLNHPVILFSSAEPRAELPTNVTFVKLPDDSVEGFVQPINSVFHYTPYDSKTFERFEIVIHEIKKHAIQHLYVDVSVELAILAKLFGLKVGYAVMQGKRTDMPHTYGYNAVDFLLSHNSALIDKTENRNTVAPTYYSGGVSRYKKVQPKMPSEFKKIVVSISPTSQAIQLDKVYSLAKPTPTTEWQIIGPVLDGTDEPNVTIYGAVDNVVDYYRHADVIIGAGGNNTIMEAAAAGKPFICIPEQRPYDEQLEAALALKRLNAAVYLPDWPTANEWPEVLQKLRAVDLQAFSNLVDDDGAQNAARIIEQQFNLV